MIWPIAAAALLAAAGLDTARYSLPEFRVVAAPARRDSSGTVSVPEVLVEADRLSRAAVALPAATVITRAAIEASGAVNLGEILRPVVGVRVASLGGIGAFTPVSIRGSSNDQVLVLIDGRRMNAAQGGGVDLSDVPLDNIERIEVIRGGSSALYGADAIGGVLNLITRDPSGNRSAEMRAEMGSFDTRLLSGRLTGSSGVLTGAPGATLSLNGRFLASNGDYRFDDDGGHSETRSNEDVASTTADLGLVVRPGFASRIEARAGYFQAEKGVPGAAQFPSESAVQTDERSALDVELRGLSARRADGVLSGPNLVTNLSGFAQRQIRWFEDPEYPLGAVDESHRNDSFGVRIDQFRDFGAAGRFTAGLEYRADFLESTTDGQRDRSVRAVVLQHSMELPAARVVVTPAFRLDASDDFPTQGSPKLLAAFHPLESIELRGSAGRSYRPPSFTDLFLPARASAAGNPGLRPEKSVDADFGGSWSSGAFGLGATAFYNRITDLIQWIPGAAGVWRPHNVTGARIAGLEAEGHGSLPLAFARSRIHLQANYTFIDPRDVSDEPNTGGRILVYRPRHRANVQVRLPLGRWAVESQWRYTGPVYVTRANTKSLPGYATLDGIVRWRAGRGLSLEARGLNLTDVEYQDIRDYPVPGRQWRLGVGWRLGGNDE